MKELAESKDTEQSDREWRQMRRTLSKLEFEPVPETPALLPRSLYGESAKDEEIEPTTRRNAEDDDLQDSNHQESPTSKKSAITMDATADSSSLEEGGVGSLSPAHLVTQVSFELPSTSTSVFPPLPPPVFAPPAPVAMLKSPVALWRAKKPVMHSAASAGATAISSVASIAGVCADTNGDEDQEIGNIEAHMAAAQEAIRQSVMTAVKDVKAKLVRESDLERMKLAAAHANDVAMLQHKIEELKTLVVQTDESQSHQSAVLERYSAFTAKRARQSRLVWSKTHSVSSCFQAWKALRKANRSMKHAQQIATRYHRKRMQKTHFQAWKTVSQQSQFLQRVHNLQEGHEHRLVDTVNEYQLKIQQVRCNADTKKLPATKSFRIKSVSLLFLARQLQQELEESKRQIAISQKCRQQLEDDLRQVFLRGVSAMNIEALTLFNTNHKTKREEYSGEEKATSDRLQSSRYSEEDDEMSTDDIALKPYSVSRNKGERAEDWSNDGAAGAGSEDTNQASPEILTRQPTARENLDAKLKEMLASSTSRLETSLNSNRVMMEKRSTHSAVGNSTLPQGVHHHHSDNGLHRTSSPPSANLLRSAEMVQQHMYGITPLVAPNRSLEASLAFQAALSFAKQKPVSKPNIKHQVEAEYIRSTIAAGRSTSTSSRA